MFHVKQNQRETSIVLFTKLKNAIFNAKIISKIKKKHRPKKTEMQKNKPQAAQNAKKHGKTSLKKHKAKQRSRRTL